MTQPADKPLCLATFRFYGELADFLPPRARGRDLEYAFDRNPSVKDAIEAQGIPHPEIALILVNGRSVDFTHPLRHDERVSVYPAFRRIDPGAIARLPNLPTTDEIRFVCDVHLGKLARRLRMHGFDTLYENDYSDSKIACIAQRDQRVALTRDRRLLHRKAIDYGYCIRSPNPDDQVTDALQRYGLKGHVRPFYRCLECNGRIRAVPKEVVLDQLEPKTKLYYERFFRCQKCGKIYWQGSHFERMRRQHSHTLGPNAKAR